MGKTPCTSKLLTIAVTLALLLTACSPFPVDNESAQVPPATPSESISPIPSAEKNPFGLASVIDLARDGKIPKTPFVLTETTHEYDQVIFLEKSISTMPIVEGLLPSPVHDKAVAILLTPLLTSNALAKSLLQVNQTIFLAIGTSDHYYDATVIQNLQRNKPHVHLHLVPEANHALEIGFDPDASIACLQGVMKAMQTFLTSVGR